MVLPDSDRVTRVPPYSGTDQKLQIFAYGTITLYGEPFQTLLLTIHFVRSALQPQEQALWFGLIRVRSPLLSESLLISIPPGT